MCGKGFGHRWFHDEEKEDLKNGPKSSTLKAKQA